MSRDRNLSVSERQRRQRLAAALRENLKRRKEQERGRQGPAEPPAGRRPHRDEKTGQ